MKIAENDFLLSYELKKDPYIIFVLLESLRYLVAPKAKLKVRLANPYSA
jgi:hypothetical protein